jgi:hypothetical protein
VIQTTIIKSPPGTLSFTSPKLSITLNDGAPKEISSIGINSTLKKQQLNKILTTLITSGATTKEIENAVKKIIGDHGTVKVHIAPISTRKKDKKNSKLLKMSDTPIFTKIEMNKYEMCWNNIKNAKSPNISINPINDSFSIPIGYGTIKLNGVDLTVKNNMLLWNNAKKPPIKSGITITRCPDLTAISSKEITAMIISPLEYFIANERNTYQIRKLPPKNSPGIIMKLIITPKKKDIIRLKMNIQLNVLKSRIPLRGTNLKVGKPIIISDAFTQTLTRKLGDWILTCGYSITEKSKNNSNRIYLIQRVVAKP